MAAMSASASGSWLRRPPLAKSSRIATLLLAGTVAAAAWGPAVALRQWAFTAGGSLRGLGLRPPRVHAAGSRAAVHAASETLKVKGDIHPLGNYLLVRVGKPEEVTKAGLVLPGRQKACEGEVVAVGPGQMNARTGELEAMSIAKGAKVVYSKGAFFDKFELEGLDHGLLPEDEILLSYQGEEPSLDSVSLPRGRALVQLAEKKRETDGGLLISEGAAGDQSNVGVVLAVGEGAEEDGVLKGDLVRFRYGDELKLKLGGSKDKYMSVRSSECIAKAKAPEGAAR